MGLLRRLLGGEKNVAKPYVDAGVALIYKLTASLNLDSWNDRLPSYTPPEVEAINTRMDNFQKMANDVAGGEARFHPEIVSDLQRMLVSEALIELAGDPWEFSDEIPPDWRKCVGTYLKAWAAHFDPMALLKLGDLLVKAGYRSEAKETFRVVLLFPTYADTYFSGQQKKHEPDLVDSIVSTAKQSLQDLR